MVSQGQYFDTSRSYFPCLQHSSTALNSDEPFGKYITFNTSLLSLSAPFEAKREVFASFNSSVFAINSPLFIVSKSSVLNLCLFSLGIVLLFYLKQMVNLIKNIVKSKENEIVSAKQYENKSGSINIVMGLVVCELLSTQYLPKDIGA